MSRTIAIFWLTALLLASNALAAVCNPPTRNSASLQACIDTASASLTDKVVEIAGGTWTIDTQVIVKQFVTLRGPACKYGTTFNVTYGPRTNHVWDVPSDYLDGAVMLERGTLLEGITFFYPGQTTTGEMVKFAPSVGLNQTASSAPSTIRIERNFFINSYMAISAVPKAPVGFTPTQDRLIIRENEFGAHARGIKLDYCHDICKVELNHFSPNIWPSAQDDTRKDWIWQNGVALEAVENDFLWVDNFFAWCYKSGVYLAPRTVNGVTYTTVLAHLQNVSCDQCKWGIYSNFQGISEAYWPHKIVIDGGQIVAHNPVGAQSEASAIKLKYVREVVVTNAVLWASNDSAVHLDHVNWFTVSHNIINQWNRRNLGTAGVKLESCSYGNVIGNVGSTSLNPYNAIDLIGCSRVSTSSNSFELPSGYVVKFDASTSYCRSMGDHISVLNQGTNNNVWP